MASLWHRGALIISLACSGVSAVRLGAQDLITTASADGQLADDAAVREVSVSKSVDRKSATITFEHDGVKFKHDVHGVNVYTPDAKVVRHTSEGPVLVQVGEAEHFQTRQPGRWASATLHDDGSVSGLFQAGQRVVRVDSTTKHDPHEKVASLLEVYSGPGVGHLVQTVNLTALPGNTPPGNLDDDLNDDSAEDVGEPGSLKNASSPAPPAPSGGLGAPEGREKPDDVKWEMTHQEEMDFMTGPMVEQREGNWGGEKWFGRGDCYAGDNQLHTLKIKLVGDVEYFKKHKDNSRYVMQQIVFESSFVYEMQMNFRLQVEKVELFESENTAPTYAKSCYFDKKEWDSSATNWLQAKLMAMRDYESEHFRTADFSSMTQMLTACTTEGCKNCPDTDYVGWGFIRTLCMSNGMSTGVSQVQSTGNWLTFIHEIGHVIGGMHSFEEGQGKTGGIMDYGDKTLNGIYQFNTKYRKAEICAWLNRVGDCRGKFIVTSPNDPPVYMPPQGGPAPSPNPQLTPGKGKGDGKGFGGS